jgi:hypothetical protein
MSDMYDVLFRSIKMFSVNMPDNLVSFYITFMEKRYVRTLDVLIDWCYQKIYLSSKLLKIAKCTWTLYLTNIKICSQWTILLLARLQQTFFWWTSFFKILSNCLLNSFSQQQRPLCLLLHLQEMLFFYTEATTLKTKISV